MSQQESDGLINEGLKWLARVNIGRDDNFRDQLIAEMNESFDQVGLNIRVGRGWWPYDPVVKVGGKAHTYEALAQWARQQGDGGSAVARQFLTWVFGNLQLTQLPPHLQALAVITHFAEVGRGYRSSLIQLYNMLHRIAEANGPQDARTAWGNYRVHYAPALKYGEDLQQNFA